MQDLTPLAELERQRAEFLGLVSQELRTPLMSIKGAAATALGASLPLNPADTQRIFRIIDEQADRMNDLIAMLLGCYPDRDGYAVDHSRTNRRGGSSRSSQGSVPARRRPKPD